MLEQIIIGSDHAGFSLKRSIIEHCSDATQSFEDRGCFDEQSVNYPDIAHDVSRIVDRDNSKKGILICGTGIGMSITANRYKNIRAALAMSAEIAQLAKEHNNANILCLSARFLKEEDAFKIIETWLTAQFQYGRHDARIKLI